MSGHALQTFNDWLPVIFAAVMGLAILAYVILDGFDLGIGILLPLANDGDKDLMVSAIGPFWDANETWLVLGVGVLLVAFPLAHGVILGALYLPVAIMLVGLILRGVSFDFRSKAPEPERPRWNRLFALGSLIASMAQGYMLGRYVLGFEQSATAYGFAFLIALCLPSGYMLLGGTWLILKCEGALQLKAVVWSRRALIGVAVGVLLISLATPWVSDRIAEKWFSLPYLFLLMPIPLATMLMFFITERSLRRLPERLGKQNAYGDWVPFAASVGIFMLAFYGLAYSVFPYLVIDQIDLWQAASAPESLKVILYGTLFVLPVIVAYSWYTFRVFRGKTGLLHY